MSAVQRFFKQNQYIFKDGEPSQALFIIRRGTVSIRKAKGTAQVELAKIYPNEVLGETSFFDRKPRSASAVADTDVEVLEISFDAMDKVYEGVPAYIKTMMASIADRLRKANEILRKLQKVLPADASPPDLTQATQDHLHKSET